MDNTGPSKSSDWSPNVPIKRLVLIGGEIERMIRPWDVEHFGRAVLAKYQIGLQQSLSKTLRTHLTAARVPRSEVAGVIGVTEPAVSQWFNGGGMKSPHLIHLLHHYSRIISPHPMESPRGRKEMAVGGYTEAMFFIRNEVMRDGRCGQPISREEFAALEQSFTNAAWLSGDRVRGTREILAAAEQELAPLGLRPQPKGSNNAWIGEVTSAWGTAYLCSVNALSVAAPAPGKP
jgi:hypothetical protein